MRYNRPDDRPSVLAWLIAGIVAGFVLENVFLRLFHSGPVFEWLFALSPSGLRAGHVWSLLTYGFLHSPDNLLHIVFNLLGLYFLGRALLPVMGGARFLGLFLASVALGGATWCAVNWHANSVLIGASAGVMSLLIFFACLYPDQEMTFLILFVIPVRMKPKYIALACVAIDLAGCVFYEILGQPSPFGFAHSAHLGGMAAGWLYFRFVHNREWRLPGRSVSIELPAWMKRTRGRPAAAATHVAGPAPGSRGDLRAEVDRILDKINSQGFGALTADEKRLLDEARDTLSRR
jgi:membrane associated rhomboid family serine protease